MSAQHWVSRDERTTYKETMDGEHEECFFFLTSRLTHVIWAEEVKVQSVFIFFDFLSALNVMADREELFFQ